MADNRLHLQHGPIDLILHVDASEEIRKRLYSAAKKRFSTVLQELVVEMDLLKQPWSADLPDPKGGIAQKMCFAVRGSGIPGLSTTPIENDSPAFNQKAMSPPLLTYIL